MHPFKEDVLSFFHVLENVALFAISSYQIILSDKTEYPKPLLLSLSISLLLLIINELIAWPQNMA